jgi:hypothetical protein
MSARASGTHVRRRSDFLEVYRSTVSRINTDRIDERLVLSRFYNGGFNKSINNISGIYGDDRNILTLETAGPDENLKQAVIRRANQHIDIDLTSIEEVSAPINREIKLSYFLENMEVELNDDVYGLTIAANIT